MISVRFYAFAMQFNVIGMKNVPEGMRNSLSKLVGEVVTESSVSAPAAARVCAGVHRNDPRTCVTAEPWVLGWARDKNKYATPLHFMECKEH